MSVRDTLEGSIAEIKSLVGPGQEAYAESIDFLTFAARRAALSTAPLLQDLWVLFELGEERNGYFVEFGAADGRGASTTQLLETLYGWQGAIAEPARSRHEALRGSRTCYVTNKFIYTDDGLKILFNDTASSEDPAAGAAVGVRRGGKRYEVETITLRSFLQAAQAPRTIDYMSINAEDDTLDILERFDFSQHDVTLLSVANADPQQSATLAELMARTGYERRFEPFSLSDVWYAKRERAVVARPEAA
ncbi:FkbM family methyltransferase [Methylobacterium sp. E-005]|uniref:FkbM family methyltransferase n=1 Tax=Methylobacterium sp. E-005 TaxID=2836549 RepID=UPI001FBAA404|nr:FkbM family methyltransferase [Methylobacterium sp. E-005]MCJ2089022.1 FkbM family methyltransferase [Methylobacterium sp. E-005]